MHTFSLVSSTKGPAPGVDTLEELLLELCFCDLNLDRLVHLLRVAASMVCIILDGGGEEGVDEGRLAQA